MNDPIVIVSAARTPIGGLLGDFAALSAHQLGAIAIKAAVERAGVPGDAIDEALIGNCLMAGQGQAPARQAVLGAGLPQSVGAVTLSKMCGSGMRAMMFGHDMLASGSADIVLAGGMESMTNAPHLTPMRKGVKYGLAQLYDHMAIDGLEDAYEKLPNGNGKAMGVFAEECVAKYKFTREQMDGFAIASTQRSKRANEDGSFDWEMAPVTLAGKAGPSVIKFDEQPFKAKLDKIAGLKPAFTKDGSITAATSSSISDGAAALVLMRESTAMKRGLTPMRKGVKYGLAALYDHMALDGLEDAYEKLPGVDGKPGAGKAMGVFAEDCVAKYRVTREQMDQFAIASTQRAKQANEDGSFDWEMAPVTLAGRGGETIIKFDEQPFKAKLDKIAGLKPAFTKDGLITAATSSSISDGAAALVLMRESTAMKLGRTPLARIRAHAVHAQAPGWFTTAPAGAIDKVLKQCGWAAKDVDLWEVNEAFAVVTLAAMAEFKLPHEIVNVHGGAVALGHPIGASGARIVVTLLGALRKRGLKRGVAALCIGGGEATALAVELI